MKESPSPERPPIIPDVDLLDGKKILIVDDEPDVLETLSEILYQCEIETAQDFTTAKDLLNTNTYDAAILDIMGVDGNKLLEISTEQGIPAVMFTAYAFEEKNFKDSIRKGANAYIPKEKMADIEDILAELVVANERETKKSGKWFVRLKSYFDDKFGHDWRNKDRSFWGFFGKKFATQPSEIQKDTAITDKILKIKGIDIFQGLSIQELAAISSVAEEQISETGDVVVREGEVGESMFLMINGEVAVIKYYETDNQVEIDRMSDLDYFGEMSLFDSEKRSATIKAEKPSHFLVLNKFEFNEVVREYPQVSLNVTRAICSRIRRLSSMAAACNSQ